MPSAREAPASRALAALLAKGPAMAASAPRLARASRRRAARERRKAGDLGLSSIGSITALTRRNRNRCVPTAPAGSHLTETESLTRGVAEPNRAGGPALPEQAGPHRPPAAAAPDPPEPHLNQPELTYLPAAAAPDPPGVA